jgi:DNA invertase Pin-like site-specific DNA recombinase
MVNAATRKKIADRLAKSNRKSKLTTRDKEDIAKRFANGEPVVDIAKLYEVSLVTVYRWVNRAAEDTEQ